MARMHNVEVKISSTKKNVIFLVSSDKNILGDIFAETSTIYDLATKRFKQSSRGADFRPNSENLYKKLINNGSIVDCYEACNLNSGKFFKAKSDSKSLEKEPFFYFITDFHIIDKTSAAHFIKQFLELSKKRKLEEPNDDITLFIVSPNKSAIPVGFENSIELIDVEDFDDEDIRKLVEREAINEKEKRLTEQEKLWLSNSYIDYKGLSKQQILEVIVDLQSSAGTIIGRSGIDKDNDITVLNETRRELTKLKRQEIAKVDDTVTIRQSSSAVSGLDAYVKWLESIKDDFRKPEEAQRYGIASPRGVLFVGVPGSGKTQAAKFTAHTLGITLVQFKLANIKGGLVGETEGKFRQAQKKIEALAPCVVLIDEIEKQFNINKNTHETTLSIFAEFLEWMQENEKQIFFFATCNSLDGIPPELTRDGRFDKRYSVFMPNYESLRGIIEFHLKKVNGYGDEKPKVNIVNSVTEDKIKDISKLFLEAIEKRCEPDGQNWFYTGANIENLIKETQRALKRQVKAGIVTPPCSAEYYKKLMLKTADECKPYGITNMGDIVNFYTAAKESAFSDASVVKANLNLDYDRIMGERINSAMNERIASQ